MRSSPSKPDPLDPGPKGFAHRGLHRGRDVPENSLTAVAAALDSGAGIECDLRLTADRQVLVFHDSDAMRMCRSSLRIGSSTHAQLQRLKVGEGPIATLKSLLELVKGQAPLLLEVKVDGDVRRWVPALRHVLSDYLGPFGVMSFDPRISRLLKAKLPGVRRGLVLRPGLTPWRRRLAMWLADPDFLAVGYDALGQKWLAEARGKMPVYSWTVRTPEQRAQAQVHADALIWEADGRP